MGILCYNFSIYSFSAKARSHSLEGPLEISCSKNRLGNLTFLLFPGTQRWMVLTWVKTRVTFQQELQRLNYVLALNDENESY